MKHVYFCALFMSMLFSSAVNAQNVIKLYDHDTSNLGKIYNMPFDQNRLLVLEGSGISSTESVFNEYVGNQLIPLSFNGVDTIYGTPQMKDDKMFFVADVTPIGKELVAYDGALTYWFDFNPSGDSDPELIRYDDEIFVIANNGGRRQLYKYLGGTNFLQISDEIDADVEELIAERGSSYYYTSYDASFGSSAKIRETIDPQGTVSHSDIYSITYPSNISKSVQNNGNIYFLNSIYTFSGASNYVLEITVNGNVSTYHSLITTGLIYNTRILEFDNKLLFYHVDPSDNDLIELTAVNQSSVFAQLSGYDFNNHIIANGELILYGSQQALEVSNGTPNVIFMSTGLIIQEPALITNEAFYMYDFNSIPGEYSKIYEIETANFNVIEYDVVMNAGYSFSENAAVEHDGIIKFLFRENEQGVVSSDIFSLNSILEVEDLNRTDFEIYPNPIVSGGLLKIQSNSKQLCSIMTAGGSAILHLELVDGLNQLDIRNLQSGVYFLKIENSVQRLIVL